MYRLSACLIAFALFAGNAVSDSYYQPPAIGTQITWQKPLRGDQGARETRVSKVVARGEDFVIYQFDLSYSEEKASSYFAEFSGLHIASCLEPMPTDEDRRRLQAFWPLQPGRSVEIGSEEIWRTTYEVGPRIIHTVSQIEGARPAQIVLVKTAESVTSSTVSLDWGTPVLQELGNGKDTRAIELFEPVVSTSAVSISGANLGQCEGLLN